MLRLILAPIGEPLSGMPDESAFCEAEWQRLRQISHPKRRAEYIAGHQLLRLAATVYAQDLGIQSATQAWYQPPASAPRLQNAPHILTGISHSQGWVVAAIARTEQTSDQLGVDIELNRPRKNLAQLARYSFGEQWLKQHQQSLIDAFFLRWTQCEALVKASTKTLGTQLLNHQRFSTQYSQGLPGYSASIKHQGVPDFTVSVAGLADHDIQLEILDPMTGQRAPADMDWQSWWAED